MIDEINKKIVKYRAARKYSILINTILFAFLLISITLNKEAPYLVLIVFLLFIVFYFSMNRITKVNDLRPSVRELTIRNLTKIKSNLEEYTKSEMTNRTELSEIILTIDKTFGNLNFLLGFARRGEIVFDGDITKLIRSLRNYLLAVKDDLREEKLTRGELVLLKDELGRIVAHLMDDPYDEEFLKILNIKQRNTKMEEIMLSINSSNLSFIITWIIYLIGIYLLIRRYHPFTDLSTLSDFSGILIIIFSFTVFSKIKGVIERIMLFISDILNPIKNEKNK